MLAVLIGMHRAAEHHHCVPPGRIPGCCVAVRDDPTVEVIAALDDDVLEQPSAAGDGRVVDDREHAHAATAQGSGTAGAWPP